MLDVRSYFRKLKLPDPDSHKGQNGKLLIIGGSELFHAASRWSLDVASKFVDMLFYASTSENNELIREAKGKFWNGIVIRRDDLEDYIEEADVVLIGPGMQRDKETRLLVDNLLRKYPEKKWVLDAGAIQMLDPLLLTKTCVLTPHKKELDDLLERLGKELDEEVSVSYLKEKVAATLVKGKVDSLFTSDQEIEIPGGNAGMTKGGTGDVLAGLLAALYCNHDAVTASVIASVTNKKAAEKLYKTVGPFFNASDLVAAVPETLWRLQNS